MNEKEIPEKVRKMGQELNALDGSIEDRADMLRKVKKIAEKYGFDFSWPDDMSYEAISRSIGTQYVMDILKQIHDGIPLSLKGFEKMTVEKEVRWSKSIGNKVVTIYSPISADEAETMPASGDLPKRVLMSIYKFARHRKTAEPGPIRFRELLDSLGMPRASQPQRKRIREHCESFARSGLEVKKWNEKGKQIYFRYTPFFDDFKWEGGLDYEATIFPAFNDKLGRTLIEEDLLQYVWFDDKRLKPLPKGMTDRDRLAQDKLTMYRGLPVIRRRMKNWLIEFGQYTETELEKIALKELREFVNFNFDLARRSGLITFAKVHRYRDKRKYLGQTINIFPARAKQPTIVFPGDPEIEELVDALIWWAYEPEHEFRVKKPEVETRKQLENYIVAHGMEIVRVRFEGWLDREDENWYPDPDYGEATKSNWMKFWEDLRRYAAVNRAKKS